MRENGKLYSNPSDIKLDALGYLTFIDSPKGEDAPGTVQVARYRVENDSVCRNWIYVEDKSFI